jgi:hypothetical protein
MKWILAFIVAYVVVSVWDLMRVNGLFAKFVSQSRKSKDSDHQPEWLVRRLKEQSAEDDERP